MAERPIFIPTPGNAELVKEIFFELRWHPGFAVVQKEKNIKALHAAAAAAGFAPLLEISTKSENKRGRHMSAFHMTVPTKDHGSIKLELAFQGSKVFEHGGPFTDLYMKGEKEIGQAKRDPRLKESGALTGFRFEGFDFPLEPKTVFLRLAVLLFSGELPRLGREALRLRGVYGHRVQPPSIDQLPSEISSAVPKPHEKRGSRCGAAVASPFHSGPV